MPVNYFFEGLSNTDLPSDYDSWQEANTVSPYLDFVSSGEGVQLNKAFLKIEDDVTRRKILAIVEDIARVAGDTKS